MNIFGVKSIEYKHGVGEPPIVTAEFIVGDDFIQYNFTHAEWDDLIPGKAIVKCKWCGQWVARKTSCFSCGGAVE